MSRLTGLLSPWKDGDTISAARLTEWQRQTITSITVQQGSPLSALRNGNNVVIGFTGKIIGPKLGTSIYVNLSQTGGSNGTGTTAPSYTYTATFIDGTAAGTVMSPAVGRPNGPVTAATKGEGYIGMDGVFVLWKAEEIPTTFVCS